MQTGLARRRRTRIGTSGGPDLIDFLLGLLPAALRSEAGDVEQHIREGRFQRSLALIAGLSSILSGFEVTTEHYRGSYSQRVMYSPVLLSPALLLAGLSGALSKRAARTVLPAISLITMLDGAVGFFMHVRGVKRKPAGWHMPVEDVIMGPPVLAPLLFAISGYLGLVAALIRQENAPPRGDLLWRARRTARLAKGGGGLGLWGRALRAEAQIREGRFQRQLAVAAAVSALCSGIEALYSHYKNNFRYGVEFTPLILTPLLAASGIATVWSRRAGRTLLPLFSLLAILDGMVGTFFHVRGVARRPGGLGMPLYNVMYGPPPFAPLLFAASGFLGLLASLLRRAD